MKKGKAILFTGASLTGMGLEAIEMSENMPRDKAMFLSCGDINPELSIAMRFLESSLVSDWTERKYFNVESENVDPHEYHYFFLDNISAYVDDYVYNDRNGEAFRIANKLISAVVDLASFVTEEGADIIILTSEQGRYFTDRSHEVLGKVNHVIGDFCDEVYLYVSGGRIKIK